MQPYLMWTSPPIHWELGHGPHSDPALGLGEEARFECWRRVEPGRRPADLVGIRDLHQSPSSMIASWMRSSPAVR